MYGKYPSTIRFMEEMVQKILNLSSKFNSRDTGLGTNIRRWHKNRSCKGLSKFKADVDVKKIALTSSKYIFDSTRALPSNIMSG